MGYPCVVAGVGAVVAFIARGGRAVALEERVVDDDASRRAVDRDAVDVDTPARAEAGAAPARAGRPLVGVVRRAYRSVGRGVAAGRARASP